MRAPSTALLALFVATGALAGRAWSKTEGRKALLGGWQLATLEEMATDGQMRTAECSGTLNLTPDGHMSVQVMYTNTTRASNAYSQSAYEASFGRYELDSRSHRLIYHIEGALVRSLVGQRQERRYALSANKLVIKPVDPTEHWRVTWQRH